ncbi:MAG: hypothetical protein AAGB12_04740 [Pseudomonadota bacterium]
MLRHVLMQPLKAAMLMSSLYVSAQPSSPENWDIVNSQFLGAHCNNMSSDDISINDNGQIEINFQRMESIDILFESKNCTIKIPFVSETLDNSLQAHLAVKYQLSEQLDFLVSLGLSKEGHTKQAESFIFNDASGSFSASVPVELNFQEQEKKGLKIIISKMAILQFPSSQGAQAMNVCEENSSQSIQCDARPVIESLILRIDSAQ